MSTKDKVKEREEFLKKKERKNEKKKFSTRLMLG